jgi:3,4-dihydroxy 2-butanone 4-phosphate synthase/GTP cyclohydrolase II
VFEILGESRQFFALTKGVVATPEPILCRVHSGSLVADLFSSTRADGGRNLREAILTIEREGAGVVLYIPPRGDLRRELTDASWAVEANGSAGTADASRPVWTLREFGLGAQVLAELGAQKLRLLTNSQPKIVGLTGFGLTVVERVPLTATKKDES